MDTKDLDNQTYEYFLERDRKKRRRIWLVIIACFCFLPVLTYLETRFFQVGPVSFPVSGNVLVFALINLNVLLLLLMIFLVLRNLVQLVFERRRRFLGTRLRTKLVISFVSLSLIPTGLLFFIALQFVSTSMDYWFNINVEQSLQESLKIAKTVYQDYRDEVTRQAESIASGLEAQTYWQLTDDNLSFFLKDTLKSTGLSGLEIISAQKVTRFKIYQHQFTADEVPPIPVDLVRKALAGEPGLVTIQQMPAGELVRGITPVSIRDELSPSPHILVTSKLIPNARLERMTFISKGLEGYRQLMLLKTPIKTSLLVMLLIVTLLIIFSAIWFGFYVARGLTVPIRRLADATRRVAEGELDFVIEKSSADEMGTLVDSFNRMTRDLLVSKHELEKTNIALLNTAQEMDNRRRYTETILQNVAAGVISIDENGKITTINRFAEELLHIEKKNIIGRHYRSVMHPNHLAIFENFLVELRSSGQSVIQRPVRLTVRDESFYLRVNFTKLEDEKKKPLGAVLVFDNLTELEKAQRMAAWREVARRIAHEVKNPLTPIQLSAQRLRKKYLGRLDSEGDVFDLCTKTIINQVDELKRLVSEFSSFARMPAVEKSENNLLDMVREVVVLYEEAHKNIDFAVAGGDGIPSFSFDLKQMKRVLINLLDNAVAAMPEGGRAEIVLSMDEDNKMAVMEVCDTGQGISDDDKPRLFEPYFSTKKTGTGLGLAIASTVVADHGGYIKVKDNAPSGARFVVELPLVGQ